MKTGRGLPGVSRRAFLKGAAATITLPTIVSAAAVPGAGRIAPSDRLNIGVVGLGSRGFNLINELLAKSETRIAAVCDVDAIHFRDQEWGKGTAYGRGPAKELISSREGSQDDVDVSSVDVYSDYRELCSRDGIDAVVVATPDHWHALCTIEALRQGKDVYCEKPVTHTFREGQIVYREVAAREAVFQTGSQQRSEHVFRRAVQLVRNGHLGRVKSFEVGLPPGYDEPMGDDKESAPPRHLDYAMWCGPAPVLPYMRARHHRWWRGHRAYGGGVLMDWIGHHNDIAHWAIDQDRGGPVRVESIGWTEPKTDIYNTPHQFEIRCEYADGTTSSIASHHPVGTKITGENGWLFVARGKLTASDPRWTERDFQPGDVEIYDSRDHMANFIECVKSRKDCIAPAETAHRSITPGHLGYVSQELGTALQWDPETETVLDNPRANDILNRLEYEEPWKIDAAD